MVVELPALLEALHDRAGDVATVGFHRGAWQVAPSRVDIAGSSVLLVGFASEEPHTVLVIGSSGQRVTLTVLAPGTAHHAAITELASFSSTENAAQHPATDVGNARSLQEVTARLAAMEGRTTEPRTHTIEQWVWEAAGQFVDARVEAHVPILVEHIVR